MIWGRPPRPADRPPYAARGPQVTLVVVVAALVVLTTAVFLFVTWLRHNA